MRRIIIVKNPLRGFIVKESCLGELHEPRTELFRVFERIGLDISLEKRVLGEIIGKLTVAATEGRQQSPKVLQIAGGQSDELFALHVQISL